MALPSRTSATTSEALGLECLISEKLGWLEPLDHVRGERALGRELARRACALALLLHGPLETGEVDLQAALARDVGGEVRREPVGVVEAEHVDPGDGAARARRHVLEHLHALAERLGEAFLFRLQGGFHQRLLLAELRVGVAHQPHQRRHHPVEERLVATELPAVAERAADDPAQHVAAALVRGQHAVDDQEGAGTNVVRDHAQRLVAEVAGAGEFGGCGDQFLEQVDLVVRVHVLQHRRKPLQAHAGIDAGRGQRRQGPVLGPVELHEHEVPYLDVAVAFLVGRSRRAAFDTGSVVEEHLGARAAGAGVGHLPEVVGGVGRALVVADADHALARNADLVGPDRIGLVVGLVDRDPKLVRRDPVDLRQQLPGVAGSRRA
jgi:hypothetical protein